MARLIVVTPDGERTVELDGRSLTVGRDPTNDIPLVGESKASRRHCRFVQAGDGWEVDDLGSTNGTRVNGAVAEKKVLSTGDVVEIGAVKIRFEDPIEAERLRSAGEAGVCFLEWVSNGRKGEKVMLTAQRTSIGRRETNTIVLKDRMASAHHAEIVRDLNGYTIRDLGSTNGTLANGEPTTETVLTHGMRIRIGNSKFVFKDPSMKDVEVELSQFDEDAGWGMMGDIDLSRARGSKVGALAVVLLFAAAGAGMWFLSQQEKAPEVVVTAGNRIPNGEFEEEDLAWAGDPEDVVDVARAPAFGGRGSLLSVAHRGDDPRTARVLSTTDLERIGRRPFHVQAKFRAAAGSPDLAVVWESRPEREDARAGVVALTETVPLPVRSGGTVDATVVPPRWASVGRLAVRLPPGSRATLDSVRVEMGGADAAHPVLEGPDASKPLAVDPAGVADLVSTRTVLMVGAVAIARVEGQPEPLVFRPGDGGVPAAVAKDQDGRPTVEVQGTFVPADPAGTALPGTLRWTATEEGFRADVACEGAAEVGLSTDLVAAHLAGAVNVLGAFAPQPLPATPGQRQTSVSKVLAGDAEGTATRAPVFVAFLLADAKPEGTVEIVASDDPSLVRLRCWLPGPKGNVQVVTDFTVQKRGAEQRLAEARAILADRPGRAIRILNDLAQEFPFDKAIGVEALRLAREREKEAREDLDLLEKGLADYRIYRSAPALRDVEARARKLTAQLLASDGSAADPVPADAGPLETRAAALKRQVEEARHEHDVQNALPEVLRLEQIVALLAEDDDFRSLAALYARAILERFGAWGGEDSDIGRRVESIRKQYEAWKADPGLQAALPPDPAKKGK